MIDEDDDIGAKSPTKRYEKKVEIQIKLLKTLMTKTYDKIMILNSIVYICAVIIYVLIGPDFFELKNESWDAAQKVVNSIQLVLLFIFLFDNLTQAIAYKLDCIKQPLEILWNILILALIAISFLEILVNGSQQL